MFTEEIVQHYPTCKVTILMKGKNTMKKSISIILAVLMLVSCIPMFASAATITLDRKNVVIIPPTVSPTEVPWGAGCVADVTVTGGQLWYVDADGNRTEVAGHFDIRNKATLNPQSTGEYEPPLIFYPDDTETYGTSTSGSLSYISMKNSIVSGEWPVIYLRGKYTEVATPPAFTCDAGDNLSTYTNYTKTGGKVVDENGTNVTSYGQFYIDEANSGGKNQYLYEDTYVTARWDDIKRGGHESAYYENVLVKVTKKSATLATAPSIPAVFVGTTYGEALALLTAKVTLVGNKTTNDTTNKFWVPVYPEGITAETPINEDTTITVKYESPATDDTFTAEVAIDTYTKPIAIISENPVIDASAAKPNMKASSLVLTGGVAVKEGTETQVAGSFSIKDPDDVLSSGYNVITVVFTPDDTTSYDGSETDILVNIKSLITTAPVLDATGINVGAKVAELTVTGGETTEEGTFSFIDPEQKLVAGRNNVKLKFTPAAADAEYFETVTVSVNVIGNINFYDEAGNEIIPEIIVPYQSARLSSITSTLKTELQKQSNCPASIFQISFYDLEMNKMKHSDDYLQCHTTKEYTVKVYDSNGYYVPEIITFKLTVVPAKMNATVTYSGTNIVVNTTIGTTQRLYGEFEYYVNGEKVGTSVMEEHKYRTWFGWRPENSGIYDISVKYIEAENDIFVIDDITVEDIAVNLMWNVSTVNGSIKQSNSYKDTYNYQYGESVTVIAKNKAAFSHWSIADKNGNPVTIEGFDINSSSNTFNMPDCDIVITGVDIQERKVTAINAKIVSQIGAETDPSFYPGEKVNIELDTDVISTGMFNGFVILDADGKEIIPEGLSQDDLQKTSFSFIMPDMDITVKAKSTADDCEHLCHSENSFLQMLWKIICFIYRLFDIHQYCDCGIAHYDAPLF